MKYLLSLVLLLIGFTNYSSQLFSINQEDFIVNIDSITEEIPLDKKWKYQSGDSLIYSSPDYDDSHWDTLQTTLILSNIPKGLFEDRAWFRLHLKIDSSLINKAYTLTID